MNKDIITLIKSDYLRYGKKPTFINIFRDLLLNKNHCFTYSFWFRMCKSNGLLQYLSRYNHRKLSRKYGMHIPYKTKIGYGLYLGHGTGIIINESAVIGDNCNLSQFTTIGSNHNKAAVIGNNVYIGPSVCIVEDIKIGNNVTIGAGTVVVKDIPENATIVGVPSKIVSYENPGRYIGNKYVSV